MPQQNPPTCHAHIAAPETFVRIPAALQFNWAQAKQMQGHPISADRMALLLPGHLMSGPGHERSPALGMAAQGTVAQQIEPYHQRTQAKLAALVARYKARQGADSAP